MDNINIPSFNEGIFLKGDVYCMIFASDLDRTLVFSQKNFNFVDDESVLIDFSGDRAVSFMTKTTINLLRELSNKINFVPVSAREHRQINNIRFKEHGIKVKYMIAGNGSTVVIDGIECDIWAEKVREIKESIEISAILDILEKKYDKVRERSFGIEVFEKNIIQELIDLTSDFKGIRIEEDHRRCYVMFDGISKVGALDYLKTMLNETFVISSGDSNMDIPMVDVSDYFYVCLTGMYKDNYEYLVDIDRMYLIEDTSYKASEQILLNVKKHLEE